MMPMDVDFKVNLNISVKAPHTSRARRLWPSSAKIKKAIDSLSFYQTKVIYLKGNRSSSYIFLEINLTLGGFWKSGLKKVSC